MRAAPSSPGDVVREGAGELEVFVCAARLQNQHRVAGIVGIGNRHGLFEPGAERAFRHLALRGMPVVKLTRGGDLALDPDKLFIDATGLTETEASAVLTRCLTRFGAPPVVKNPDQPTSVELTAIQQHLRSFRDEFALAAAPRVAAK